MSFSDPHRDSRTHRHITDMNHQQNGRLLTQCVCLPPHLLWSLPFFSCSYRISRISPRRTNCNETPTTGLIADCVITTETGAGQRGVCCAHFKRVIAESRTESRRGRRRRNVLFFPKLPTYTFMRCIWWTRVRYYDQFT